MIYLIEWIAKTGEYVSPVIGRPKTIDDDGLIKTITQLALVGSSADPHCRTEVINTRKILNNLTEKLQTIVLTLKRSSVYLQLIPRRKDTTEEKRHKNVANIKLCKAQSMERKKNPDRWFAAATMKHVEELAVLMGKNNVAIIGKDDKAHILLGIPAANKQSPILIATEYPVILLDQTFAVLTKNKLIPSVYATREIKEDGLTYSGPTHAIMQSLKHGKEDVFSFMEDLKDILGE